MDVVVKLEIYAAPTGALIVKVRFLPTTHVVGYWYIVPTGLFRLPVRHHSHERRIINSHQLSAFACEVSKTKIHNLKSALG